MTPGSGGYSPSAVPARAWPHALRGSKSRVLIVENRPVVREGIVQLVNRQSDLCCCGESDSIAAAPNLVAAECPDVVLMDLNAKDGESFELVEAMRGRFPNSPVLIVSQSDSVRKAEQAMRAGARGYVVHEEAGEQILEGIRAVLRGGVYVSPELASRLVYKLIQS